MEEYKKRWKIEVLFEALKSSGFNFEDTHLKDEKRLHTLFAVLAIAFCWAYHVGAWRHEVKPIRIKKHQRPAKSIFRYGFDWIRHALFNPEDKPERLTHVLNLLWQALTGPKVQSLSAIPNVILSCTVVTKGMMRFVSGQYSPTWPLGAMLGYVMDGNMQTAYIAIRHQIEQHAQQLLYDPALFRDVKQPEHFSTTHQRPDIPIELRHLLLAAHEDTVVQYEYNAGYPGNRMEATSEI